MNKDPLPQPSPSTQVARPYGHTGGRGRLAIAAILLTILLSSGVVLAGEGALRYQTLGPGRVVELIPLEDGSAAIVQSHPAEREFTLVFTEAGSERQRYAVPWNDEVEPTMLIRACGQTVHLTLTSREGLTWYVVWDLPVSVKRVYLPVVCVK